MRPILTIVVVLSLSVPVVAVFAAPPSPFAAPGSDAILTLDARAALAADPALADLNLLVSVVDRVVVVGGPVPDLTLSTRIESVLRRLPGLVDVKVTCWVPSSEDPLRDLVGQRLVEGTKTAPPEPPPLLGIKNLTPQRPREDAPKAPELPAAESVTAQRVVPPPNMSAFLLPPVAPGSTVTPLPMPQPTAVVTQIPPSSYPTIPPTAVPTAPMDEEPSLLPFLAELKTREPRFAGLTVSLRGTTAVVGGHAAWEADAWDLATALRGVSGVDRVVVGVVRQR